VQEEEAARHGHRAQQRQQGQQGASSRGGAALGGQRPCERRGRGKSDGGVRSAGESNLASSRAACQQRRSRARARGRPGRARRWWARRRGGGCGWGKQGSGGVRAACLGCACGRGAAMSRAPAQSPARRAGGRGLPGRASRAARRGCCHRAAAAQREQAAAGCLRHAGGGGPGR
jgi:hypothetical protein